MDGSIYRWTGKKDCWMGLDMKVHVTDDDQLAFVQTQ